MEKITIKNIKTSWANKDGQAYLSQKSQRPYAMVMIETENETSLGSKRISGFANAGDPHLNWQAGGEYQVFLEKSKDGKYVNFRVPKAEGERGQGTGGPAIAKSLERMESKIDDILAWIEGQSIKDTKAPEGIKPTELNF